MLVPDELERIAELATRFDREAGIDARISAFELAGEVPRLLATIDELRTERDQAVEALGNVEARAA